MSGPVKKYKVTIAGDMYTLVSDESEEKVLALAAMVDALISDISKKAGVFDVRKTAVFAALQLASTNRTLEQALASHAETSSRLHTLLDQGLSNLSQF